MSVAKTHKTTKTACTKEADRTLAYILYVLLVYPTESTVQLNKPLGLSLTDLELQDFAYDSFPGQQRGLVTCT